VIAWLLVRAQDDEPTGPPDATTQDTTVTQPPVAGEIPPELASVPEWGDFAGAPPPLEPLPGGDIEVTDTSGGDRNVVISRPDGSRFADVTISQSGDPMDARYFDEDGQLELVIASVRAQPGPRRRTPASGSVSLNVRCRSTSRANAGWVIRSFPFRWRLNLRSMPAALRRQGGLQGLRAAHGTWNANRTHCSSIRDNSRLRFLYMGTTNRPVGRNNVNSVGFGDTARLGGVCRGSVACTLTWLSSGNRVLESDARFNSRIRGGFSTRQRVGAFDLQSVMVHEIGHTVGVAHVNSASNVMYPFAKRGDITARKLGRGDALINNSKY
ncbi:MAG: matrixin family metalloprotease, partial [Thermoleophilia bacterium]|nr:matrixin family metalloprotease [Thermoleophilia bacterium]